MKQLFLTSEVASVVEDIAKRIETKGKRLVFIDTAAEVEEGDKAWLREDQEALERVGFLVTDYSISNKTQKELERDLAQYDVINMTGGNTFYLLQQAQLSGFVSVIHDLVLKQEKTYIGTSAGSIIAGPDIYPTYRIDKLEKAPKLKGYVGFNLVNFCIFPHWGSDYFKELYLNKRLDHAYREDQVPLLALTNTQYAHVKDGWMELVDVSKNVTP